MQICNSGFVKTKKQIAATALLVSMAVHILLYGGSRSGKTAFFIYVIIVRALKCKSRHAILRFRFNHCKQSIWLDTLPKIMDVAFPGLKERCKWDKQDWYVRLPNGSEIWIGGLDDKERVEKILGNEYSSIFFNEISQMAYKPVTTALTRLAEKNILKKRAYYDCNPPRKSHWAYKLFIKNIEPFEGQPLDPNLYAHQLMNPADNIANIDADYITNFLDKLPEKQRKRFKEGQFLDDDDTGLFRSSWIQRIWELQDFGRIVVAIDPAVTSSETSDMTGITVCAKSGEFGYVLESIRGKWTPDEWASKAIELYKQYNADRIIGEVNNGGDMIESTLRNVDPNIPYTSVRATRGKVVRAEPISALYERQKIYHLGYLTDLEEEMSDFQEDMDYSPGLVDSMVWGFSFLFDVNCGDPMVASL